MTPTIEAMLTLVAEPHRTDCLLFIENSRPLFDSSKGSAVKHQPWPGGYRDHVTEVMHIACVTYQALTQIRPLPFSLSDALLCCFLHDIEKVWKHALNPMHAADVDKYVLLENEFHLNGEHLNAIKYAHGEGDDYHPTDRVQKPLAAFVHHCDNTSARIWFDKPDEAERSAILSDADRLMLIERYNLSASSVEGMPPDLRARFISVVKELIRRERESDAGTGE